MRKLLSANFARVFKSRLFWGCMAFMAAVGAIMSVMNYLEMQEADIVIQIDQIFFTCAILIGIVGSVFCSLFTGTDYSDGTIRNKIIVGHRRSAIYLAHLITAGTVLLMFCGICFLTTLCFGLPLLGGFAGDPRLILAVLLCTLLLTLALSSVFTLIALLCQNKAAAAVISVLTAFLFLIAGSYINQRLGEPETYPAYVTTMGSSEDGTGNTSTVNEDVPNPAYLRGTEREIYQFLADFLPGGQAIQCVQLLVVRPGLLSLYSTLIILGSSGIGLLLFTRKDLK